MVELLVVLALFPLVPIGIVFAVLVGLVGLCCRLWGGNDELS